MTCHPAALALQGQWKSGRFLVTDGDHIEQERPYAELYVIKYLTSLAPESELNISLQSQLVAQLL
jgi:hypothetical protein